MHQCLLEAPDGVIDRRVGGAQPFLGLGMGRSTRGDRRPQMLRPPEAAR
jgi:hypothetical protein